MVVAAGFPRGNECATKSLLGTLMQNVYDELNCTVFSRRCCCCLNFNILVTVPSDMGKNGEVSFNVRESGSKLEIGGECRDNSKSKALLFKDLSNTKFSPYYTTDR